MYVPLHLRIIFDINKGKAVVATENIRQGELVCELFFDSIRHFSLGISIQVDADVSLHNILDTIDDIFNHICEPTTRLDAKRAEFLAIRDIMPGEEITWNYLTTEYDLVVNGNDFDCKCGFPRCYGQIRGFKYLSEQQKKESILVCILENNALS